VGRIGSGVQIRASFQIIARLVGRLGSAPRLVGRIGSGVQVRATFQIIACFMGRLGHKVCLCAVCLSDQNADIFEV